MRDTSVAVKDTAAWTIGRVCEHHILAISAPQWQQMTHALQVKTSTATVEAGKLKAIIEGG